MVLYISQQTVKGCQCTVPISRDSNPCMSGEARHVETTTNKKEGIQERSKPLRTFHMRSCWLIKKKNPTSTLARFLKSNLKSQVQIQRTLLPFPGKAACTPLSRCEVESHCAHPKGVFKCVRQGTGGHC